MKMIKILKKESKELLEVKDENQNLLRKQMCILKEIFEICEDENLLNDVDKLIKDEIKKNKSDFSCSDLNRIVQ